MYVEDDTLIFHVRHPCQPNALSLSLDGAQEREQVARSQLRAEKSGKRLNSRQRS
jgi:hypothetical protein